LTERLSNEVASRTRATNVRIAERFTQLAHEQIQAICKWIDQQAIAPRMISQIDSAASALATAARS
jgi:predicted ATPase